MCTLNERPRNRMGHFLLKSRTTPAEDVVEVFNGGTLLTRFCVFVLKFTLSMWPDAQFTHHSILGIRISSVEHWVIYNSRMFFIIMLFSCKLKNDDKKQGIALRLLTVCSGSKDLKLFFFTGEIKMGWKTCIVWPMERTAHWEIRQNCHRRGLPWHDLGWNPQFFQ